MNLTVHADGEESDSNCPAGLQSGAGPAFDKTFVQLDEFLVSSWSYSLARRACGPRTALFHGSPTVKMMVVIRVGFLLRFVNGPVFMFRRTIETVQFER